MRRWAGSWDLFGNSAALDVSLVWDANYSGIEFPARATTVLRITAPRRAVYWRATTLDSFVGDRWLEALYAKSRSSGDRALPPDALLPSGRPIGAGLIEQKVEVAALVDDHVVAAGQPVRVSTSDADSVLYLSGGVMQVPRAFRRGQRYTVWSLHRGLRPRASTRSPARYPRRLGATSISVGRSHHRLGRPAAWQPSTHCSASSGTSPSGPTAGLA